MQFFGGLERFAADLYPYRWPITIVLLVLAAAMLAFAYRQGWHYTVWRRRLAAALIILPLLALAIPVGWYTLSPLWQRSFLDEPNPLAVVTAFEPHVERSGEFYGADDFHFGRGTALLIETEPGRYTLRFEEFSVRNGPDLFVYLSPNAEGYAEGALNLGELRATDGAFNYEVPPGTDVSQFESVIVWCRDFAVLFATAPLS